ncbi:baseplate J/gp47 family protein [Cryptosporangium sp. NPDC051539]|uniref:baseplate J/gp47 family protein n=1 Tax=Cryptosporangium sp. NPDC051539 TaxID=3363962 RepID=UPI00379F2787
MSSDRHGVVLARLRRTLDERLPLLAAAPSDDPALALLDAFALVADVIGFYTERVAAEGYLSTAAEDGSIRALGRTVGAEFRTAAPASTYLAFDVDDRSGAAASVLVPAGTPVQSVPGPQAFETTADLVATPEHNVLSLRRFVPQRIDPGSTGVRLAGTSTGLRAGDALLIRGAHGTPWTLRTIGAVIPAAGPNPGTRIEWTEALDGFSDGSPPVRVYALRIRADLFGYNAPDWRAMPDSVKAGYLDEPGDRPTQWPGFVVNASTLPLNGHHPTLAANTPVVVQQGTKTELRTISTVEPSSLADFAITGPATVVTLTPALTLTGLDRRQIQVYAGAEELPLAEDPLTDLVPGPDLTLDRPVDLDPGTRVLVSGLDRDGAPCGQLATVTSAVRGLDRTALVLDRVLRTPIRPDSLRVHANLIPATAGRTVTEVLGSGAAARPDQRFPLHRADLCGAPAVRVDGVAWTRVDNFYRSGPDDRHFVFRLDEEGRALIEFGDGVRGSRPTTGTENLTTTYRVGGGAASNVPAGALTLLTERPLGVRAVTNPLAAAGGADADDPEATRRVIPLRAREPDRVVSVLDHEEFALVFPGVAKARAAPMPGGRVHLTVAGSADLTALGAALAAAGSPVAGLTVAACTQRWFLVALAVLPDPARVASDVLTAVAAAVRTGFGFAARGLAQPVTTAEILTTAQTVTGVRAVVLTALRRVDAAARLTPPPRPAGPFPRLRSVTSLTSTMPALPARLTPDGVAPAELLLVAPELITVQGLSE